MTTWESLPLTLTIEQARQILGVSRATIFDIINQPDFPAIRVSARRIIIPRDSLKAWLEARAREPLRAANL